MTASVGMTNARPVGMAVGADGSALLTMTERLRSMARGCRYDKKKDDCVPSSFLIRTEGRLLPVRSAQEPYIRAPYLRPLPDSGNIPGLSPLLS